MGSCQSPRVVMVKENVNGVDTIINDQLEINPTIQCKPMLQFYNQKFKDAPGQKPEQFKIQSSDQWKPMKHPEQDFHKYQTKPPKRGSLSSTQRGILKTQQSQIISYSTSKKRVSFNKAKKRLSNKSLLESQKNRSRKVTMEMLEATF